MSALLRHAAPAVFVVLWSSAFVAAKFGLGHVEPLTFMTSRFALVTALFVLIALLFRAPWPRTRRQAFDIAVVGFLIHAVYLSGVFVAIHRGMPAGLVALICGLQPVLTALAAGVLLGERLSARQWIGCLLGFAGMALVLSDKLSVVGVTPAGIALSVLALLGISAGTLYQKRYATGMNLLSGSAIQGATACLVTFLGALAFESMHLVWAAEFVLAYLWLTLVVSLGAFSLLMAMIKHGQATKVASLFYLVPPTTAVMAFAAFGESMSAIAAAGIVVTAAGVAMVVLPARAAKV